MGSCPAIAESGQTRQIGTDRTPAVLRRALSRFIQKEAAMRQVKIFKSLESDAGKLEQEVNDWIRQSGADVVSVTGNIAPQTVAAGTKTSGLGASSFPPSDLVLIVLYEARGG